MTRKEKLQRLADKVRDCDNKLSNALGNLSIAASEIYGEELIADICGGDEIEFRVKGDADSCILLEELLSKLD